MSASAPAAAIRSRSSPPRASSRRCSWCLLTREQDYAYGQPSLTKKKLRRLELTAGAPKARGKTGTWSTNQTMRDAERALALQAELAYRRNVADWQAARPAKTGASVTTGRASNQPSTG